MTINPTASSLPVALSPASAAGGNAPSDGPSPDGFAALVARAGGGEGSPAASRTGRGRVTPGTADGAEDLAAPAGDPTDPEAFAVVLPAWVLSVPEPRGANTTSLAGTGALAADSAEAPAPSPTGSANADESAAAALLASQLPLSQLPPLSGAPATEAAPSRDGSGPSQGPIAWSTGTSTGSIAAAADQPLDGAASGATPAEQATADGAAVTMNLSESASGPATAQPGDGAAADAAGAPRAGQSPQQEGAAPASADASKGTSSAPGAAADKVRSGARAALDAALRAKNSGPAPEARAAAPTAAAGSQLLEDATREQSSQDAPRSFSDARSQMRADAQAAPPLPEAQSAAMLSPEHLGTLAAGQAPAIGHDASIGKTAEPAAVGLPADRAAAIDHASMHRQMVQAIHMQSRNGVGEARVTLQPEYLGEVTIALRVENGAVTAHVSAATAEVRTWLATNEAMLRQGLSDQGLTLDRLIVSEEPAELHKEGQSGREQSQQDEGQPRQRQRRRPDTSTFEITV